MVAGLFFYMSWLNKHPHLHACQLNQDNNIANHRCMAVVCVSSMAWNALYLKYQNSSWDIPMSPLDSGD